MLGLVLGYLIYTVCHCCRLTIVLACQNLSGGGLLDRLNSILHCVFTLLPSLINVFFTYSTTNNASSHFPIRTAHNITSSREKQLVCDFRDLKHHSRSFNQQLHSIDLRTVSLIAPNSRISSRLWSTLCAVKMSSNGNGKRPVGVSQSRHSSHAFNLLSSYSILHFNRRV